MLVSDWLPSSTDARSWRGRHSTQTLARSLVRSLACQFRFVVKKQITCSFPLSVLLITSWNVQNSKWNNECSERTKNLNNEWASVCSRQLRASVLSENHSEARTVESWRHHPKPYCTESSDNPKGFNWSKQRIISSLLFCCQGSWVNLFVEGVVRLSPKRKPGKFAIGFSSLGFRFSTESHHVRHAVGLY